MSRGILKRLVGRASGRVVLAIISGLLAPALIAGTAEAKTPGKTYCFNGVCHRVKTIAEMVALVGQNETFSTSYYDDCKRDPSNPCGLTSSGEVFHANSADNAASPIYPDGTVLLVRNAGNGKAAVVRVNNAGPYYGKRKLDVSRATAESLGFKARGVADLEVRVVSVPSESEATYKKNRRYDAVPGAIGTFASLDHAQGGMMLAMALDAMQGSLFAPATAKFLPVLKGGKPVMAQLLRASRVASAAGLRSGAAAEPVFETPADGLRAAARRAYGVERGARTQAPSSVTAEALYRLVTRRL